MLMILKKVQIAGVFLFFLQKNMGIMLFIINVKALISYLCITWKFIVASQLLIILVIWLLNLGLHLIAYV